MSKGYKAYRKFFDLKTKKWVYAEATDTAYFSSIVSGYMDIRLLKDGFKEILKEIEKCVKYNDELTTANKYMIT